MTAQMEQIKAAFENGGMTPEQIAEDLQWDVVAVKAALANCSKQYRQISGANVDLDFNESELSEVNHIIMDTARHAVDSNGNVDYRTRLDAAKYVRDDKKGRKELQKHLANTNGFNITVFNQMIQQTRESMKKVIPAHLLER